MRTRVTTPPNHWLCQETPATRVACILFGTFPSLLLETKQREMITFESLAATDEKYLKKAQHTGSKIIA